MLAGTRLEEKPVQKRLRLVLISHAMTVATTWSKSERLGEMVAVTTVIPDRWKVYGRDEASQVLPANFLRLRCVLRQKNHFHVYIGIRKLIRELRPDIVHIDEEPYSAVAWQIAHVCTSERIPYVCFTWQNIFKRYPIPFRLMEDYVLRHCSGLIGGNCDALGTFRQKGYVGLEAEIPQFGIDADLVLRGARVAFDGSAFVVAYVGRLVEEKGVCTLIAALEKLPKYVQVKVFGSGPEEPALRKLVAQMGLEARVAFKGTVPSRDMLNIMRTVDALVLPSLTRRHWKEQFGRVLIEAMAQGTPVVGSRSGEIPNVIGDAGETFREGDVDDLVRCLTELLDAAKWSEYSARGLRRVREKFTQERIAQHSLAFYRKVTTKYESR